MKILKGLQSCVILDRCVEFKIKPEKNLIVLYFYFSCDDDENRRVIKKYYPLTNEEVQKLLSKNSNIDFVCDKLKDSLCYWLSDSLLVNSPRWFDLKTRAQEIIDGYIRKD